MTLSHAKIQATIDEFDIATGNRLIACVRDGLISLDTADTINVALPSKRV